MQKIPYFSGRTKLNHFNSTMSGRGKTGAIYRLSYSRWRWAKAIMCVGAKPVSTGA